MERELVRDSPQATTLPNAQKDEGRLNFWDIALLDLFGEGRGHEPEAQKVAPAISLTTPSKSSSHACSHRWGCKYKCSFVGSFAEVEEHERICLKGQGPKEHKDENKKMKSSKFSFRKNPKYSNHVRKSSLRLNKRSASIIYKNL